MTSSFSLSSSDDSFLAAAFLGAGFSDSLSLSLLLDSFLAALAGALAGTTFVSTAFFLGSTSTESLSSDDSATLTFFVAAGAGLSYETFLLEPATGLAGGVEELSESDPDEEAAFLTALVGTTFF